MYLHLISDKNQGFFLRLARLVSISDSPLLWDGKTEEELTGDTNLQEISFKEVEQEDLLLERFDRECGGFFSGEHVDWLFISELKPLPLRKQNDPEERIKASCARLEDMHAREQEDGAEFLPSESKVMLYELFMTALADGDISSVEEALLRKFADLFQVEEFLYDDLLERARCMSRESAKTLSIILE
ncbi:hypothetical protein H7691_04360 [Stenotrophomonas sp. CW117]|jgi:hypothetical protein|uniref:hypothetical protein n=1 Tax=Stenotrophomonas TaxID=40323 RepID=UPI0007027C14|nr:MULTISPECIES: hypothetical protein [Stenotrophomonas]KRG85012.1 hypothetical protein ABB33_09030 [Stenotrophomonas acidaminiphila]OZB53734.1 MAG: hypothetical protein B7X38_02700 [Stenotrophomonas sp. 14-69-23]QOF99378.1 hypothetical protein H7691_04360 [Stenotrophomonas sp. CW117]